MPHIHTNKNEHDFVVTAYIVRIGTPEPMALFHMHKKQNKLLPVGGHVELNETPWQAMAHELNEESGYNLDELDILQPADRITNLSNTILHPLPININTHHITPDHFHTAIEYGFIASNKPTDNIKVGESTDLRWLTQVEMNKLDESQTYINAKEVYNFIFDTALTKWNRAPAKDFIL